MVVNKLNILNDFYKKKIQKKKKKINHMRLRSDIKLWDSIFEFYCNTNEFQHDRKSQRRDIGVKHNNTERKLDITNNTNSLKQNNDKYSNSKIFFCKESKTKQENKITRFENVLRRSKRGNFIHDSIHNNQGKKD